MRIYKPPTALAAISALLFGIGGLFGNLAAESIPEVLKRPWVALPLFVACILAGAWLFYVAQRPPRAPSGLAKEYGEYLFHYGSSAASIRLIGAADEWFPPECVKVTPSQDPYILPNECLAFRNEVIARLQAESSAHNRMFFDGPNTRLVDYTSTPVDNSEQKHLHLVLGPVGWYDYSVTHWYLDHLLAPPLDRGRLRKYVDLDDVAESGSIRTNAFTNILCTATTLVTADGFITYSKRSDRVSSQTKKYTSCIAENIHQEKDRSLDAGVDRLPAPFRTAIRGIEEEVSPQLADLVRANPRHLVLLGMDFDLESFHPDLLFLLAWPGQLQDIQRMVEENPGRDFVEGSMQAVRMRRSEISQLLEEPMWIPGGKASVIRAVEFVSTLKMKYRGEPLASIFGEIVEGRLA